MLAEKSAREGGKLKEIYCEEFRMARKTTAKEGNGERAKRHLERREYAGSGLRDQPGRMGDSLTFNSLPPSQSSGGKTECRKNGSA